MGVNPSRTAEPPVLSTNYLEIEGFVLKMGLQSYNGLAFFAVDVCTKHKKKYIYYCGAHPSNAIRAQYPKVP